MKEKIQLYFATVWAYGLNYLLKKYKIKRPDDSKITVYENKYLMENSPDYIRTLKICLKIDEKQCYMAIGIYSRGNTSPSLIEIFML